MRVPLRLDESLREFALVGYGPLEHFFLEEMSSNISLILKFRRERGVVTNKPGAFNCHSAQIPPRRSALLIPTVQNVFEKSHDEL